MSPQIYILELPYFIWTGGLAIIYRAEQKCTLIDVGNFISFELLSFTTSHPTVFFGLLYRPPKSKGNFLTEFGHLLSITTTNYENMILLGDLNIHMDDQNLHLTFLILSILLTVVSMSLALHINMVILSI